MLSQKIKQAERTAFHTNISGHSKKAVGVYKKWFNRSFGCYIFQRLGKKRK